MRSKRSTTELHPHMSARCKIADLTTSPGVGISKGRKYLYDLVNASYHSWWIKGYDA